MSNPFQNSNYFQQDSYIPNPPTQFYPPNYPVSSIPPPITNNRYRQVINPIHYLQTYPQQQIDQNLQPDPATFQWNQPGFEYQPQQPIHSFPIHPQQPQLPTFYQDQMCLPQFVQMAGNPQRPSYPTQTPSFNEIEQNYSSNQPVEFSNTQNQRFAQGYQNQQTEQTVEQRYLKKMYEQQCMEKNMGYYGQSQDINYQNQSQFMNQNYQFTNSPQTKRAQFKTDNFQKPNSNQRERKIFKQITPQIFTSHSQPSPSKQHNRQTIQETSLSKPLGKVKDSLQEIIHQNVHNITHKEEQSDISAKKEVKGQIDKFEQEVNVEINKSEDEKKISENDERSKGNEERQEENRGNEQDEFPLNLLSNEDGIDTALSKIDELFRQIEFKPSKKKTANILI